MKKTVYKETGIQFCAGFDGTIPCRIIEEENGRFCALAYDSQKNEWFNAVDGLDGQSADELKKVTISCMKNGTNRPIQES